MRLYFLTFITAVCFLFLLMIRKVRVRPWVAIFFLFYRDTLNNRSKCLKNGSNRLRMWNLPRLHTPSQTFVKCIPGLWIRAGCGIDREQSSFSALSSVFNKGRRPAKLAGYFTPTRRLLWKLINPIFFNIMRNIRPGSAKFFSKKKKDVTWNLSNFGPAAIDFFDRSLSCWAAWHIL